MPPMPRHQPITEGTRLCSRCKIEKPATEFFTIWKRTKTALFPLCKPCTSENGKLRRAARDRRANHLKDKEYHLKYIYGLTPDEYELKLKSQDYKCAICKLPMTKPHIDHHHLSNKLRGILCGKCNVGIGYFRESPKILQSAIDYLNYHEATTTS